MRDEDPLEHVEVVDDDQVNEGLVRRMRVQARQLTQDDVGKYIGCHDHKLGVNYQAKILDIRHFEDGNAPGTSLVCWHPPIRDREGRKERMHVPFETEFELIELIAI
ncbi:hypothetical protein [Tsukamurella tyrosinosolvens]|uniref:hypothetical protein n=1 Tax=Tsukamurella tyrosinosolvens TaxID=57704 RepID=UPI001147056B|nr:hypothetical protein [Tsukamurella tyrosinosolvens]